METGIGSTLGQEKGRRFGVVVEGGKSLWQATISSSITFVPICYNMHWSLVCIEGISSWASRFAQELHTDKAAKHPALVLRHMDSLRNGHNSDHVNRVLRWVGAGYHHYYGTTEG